MIRLFNHYVHRLTIMRMLFDMVLMLVVVAFGVFIYAESLPAIAPLAGTQAVSTAAGLFLINTASGIYEQDTRRTVAQSCARALFALLLALPLTYAIFSLLPTDFVERQAIQAFAMLGVSAVIVRRAYVTHTTSGQGTRSRVLIFGCGTAAAVVGQTLREADPDVSIIGYVPGPNEKEPAVGAHELLQGSGKLCEMALQNNVDEIIVALTERRAGSMPLRELLDCKVQGIKVYDISTHFEKRLGQIRIDYLNAGWLVFGDGFNQGPWRSAVKRVFDLFCSALLLLLAFPVMVLAALLIKLESPGPVLYRQQRTGQNGVPFDVIKFRSMRSDAEKDGKPRWATANDDRVTRVGRFIRRTRIDELPQLFNVFSGEMSLVGPRPERPFFVEQLTEQIPFFAVRHSVKPGVTGWAQVRYQYGATVEDSQQKLQYDLYYVKNHSLFLDIIVLFETVSVVLTGKGAR